jgi:hypothetical protein
LECSANRRAPVAASALEAIYRDSADIEPSGLCAIAADIAIACFPLFSNSNAPATSAATVEVGAVMRREASKISLREKPDEAILRLARVLARQAAREDHERDQAHRSDAKSGRNLCSVLDRPAE